MFVLKLFFNFLFWNNFRCTEWLQKWYKEFLYTICLYSLGNNICPICCIIVVKLLSCVQHFWYPIDCSPPASSVHGISQAGILEWVAFSFSRGSSQLRDQTCISCIGRRFTTGPPGSLICCISHIFMYRYTIFLRISYGHIAFSPKYTIHFLKIRMLFLQGFDISIVIKNRKYALKLYY